MKKNKIIPPVDFVTKNKLTHDKANLINEDFANYEMEDWVMVVIGLITLSKKIQTNPIDLYDPDYIPLFKGLRKAIDYGNGKFRTEQTLLNACANKRLVARMISKRWSVLTISSIVSSLDQSSTKYKKLDAMLDVHILGN